MKVLSNITGRSSPAKFFLQFIGKKSGKNLHEKAEMAGNRKKVKFFIQVSPLKKRSISALLEIYPINSMSKADGIGKEDAGMEAFMPLVSIAEALLIIRFGRFLKLIQ